MNESIDSNSWVDDAYISKLEMARRLDVSTRTIEIWMRQHKVPHEKIGRTVRFHWRDVRNHLSRQRRVAAPADDQRPPTEDTRTQLRALAAAIRLRHRDPASRTEIVRADNSAQSTNPVSQR